MAPKLAFTRNPSALPAACLTALVVAAFSLGTGADPAAAAPPQSASLPATPASTTGVPEGQENPSAAVDETSTSAESGATAVLDLDPSEPTVLGISWDHGQPDAEYRALIDGEWSEWTAAGEQDDGADHSGHEAEEGATATDPILVVDAARLEARTTTEGFDGTIDVVAYSSPVTDVDVEATSAPDDNGPATAYSTSQGSVLDRVIPRSTWGAQPSVCDLGNSDEKHAVIVHHTAGTNNYSRSQVPGLLRGIQQYHIDKDPTWCDIGYHMLVDKWGNIYEGRDGGLNLARVATHAAGWNSDTFGVSVMGDYTSAVPTSGVITSLQEIVGWQAKYWGYDPSGSVSLYAGGGGRYNQGERVTIRRVIGHRDVGYTTCPGANLYSKLDTIRNGATKYMSREKAALQFLDVDGTAFEQHIFWLAAEGVTGGYTDRTFRPTRYVARFEMAAFLYRYRGPSYAGPAEDPYTDIPADHSYAEEIGWAKEKGITNGYADGRYGPRDTVTRGQMATFLYSYAQNVCGRDGSYNPPSQSGYQDMTAGGAFYEAVSFVTAKGIAGGFGDGTFRPSKPTTRGEMAAFMYNLDRYIHRTGASC